MALFREIEGIGVMLLLRFPYLPQLPQKLRCWKLQNSALQVQCAYDAGSYFNLISAVRIAIIVSLHMCLGILDIEIILSNEIIDGIAASRATAVEADYPTVSYGWPAPNDLIPMTDGARNLLACFEVHRDAATVAMARDRVVEREASHGYS